MISSLTIAAAALLTCILTDFATASCSFYNGQYCSSYFDSDIILNMSANHDILIMQHLTQLKVVGSEPIISDACYHHVLAILCYSTVEVCQNSSNTSMQLCSNNCSDFYSTLEQECPHFVYSNFQQVTGLQCGNNLQDCFSVESVTSGSNVSNTTGESQVHTNCIPFPGPVECVPYMNSSFFYSYTSGYRSERVKVLELINDQPGCNTTGTVEYICNSAFPACDVVSGEPILVCESDCEAATSESDCSVFMKPPLSYPISLNCSDPLEYINANYQGSIPQPLEQCLNLETSPRRTQCVAIPENCKIVLQRNMSFPQDFSSDVTGVFIDSFQAMGIEISPNCGISLTYVSCYFAYVPCDPNGGLPLRICPEDCVVPDAISMFACKEVYDVIRSFNNTVGQLIKNFNCTNPSSYLGDSVYSQTECLPIVTLRSLFTDEIEEYERMINGDIDDDDDSNIVYIVIGAAVGAIIVITVVLLLSCIVCCCVRRHHSKSKNITDANLLYTKSSESVNIQKTNPLADEPFDNSGTVDTENDYVVNQSSEVTEGDYVNQSPKVTSVTSPLNDSIKDLCQTTVSDDHVYSNCPPGKHDSVYLPSVEHSDQDSAVISKEDIAQLSDGKKSILSALLPKGSLVIDSVLGEGAFGKVYKGYLNQTYIARMSIRAHSKAALVKQRKDDNVLTVAIKTIKSGLDKQDCLSLLKESAIMKSFDHPHVLGLVGISLNTEDGTPMIAIPFMKYGDLKTFLVSKRRQTKIKNTFPEGVSYNLLVKMCIDIAEGMEYLANKKFVHRDLAARNCMLDDEFSVKIADFGLTRDIYSKDYYKQSNVASKLPVKWMSPESLHDKISNEKTDIWSFGVTCWEIFSLGRQPYPGVQNSEIATLLEHGKRLSKPPLCDEAMFEILCSCWYEDPDDRPTFSQLVSNIIEVIKPQVVELESLENLKRNYDPNTVQHSLISSLSEASMEIV